MNENPYRSPQAEAVYKQPAEIEVPPEILKKIKGGWIAAIVSGTLTAIVAIIAVSTDAMDDVGDVFDAWLFVDVVLIFGLAFGIMMKSRTAATIMFLYFLASKIYMVSMTGQARGVIISLIFLYFYFQAMVGTYQYHACKKSVAE